jgi:NAD(P)-dependent dehydrogenase (short-subunit alcohol dehydrogenase family)
VEQGSEPDFVSWRATETDEDSFKTNVNIQGSGDHALDRFLVNNSGVYEYVPLETITEEHFHRHFNINVLGRVARSSARLVGAYPK